LATIGASLLTESGKKENAYGSADEARTKDDTEVHCNCLHDINESLVLVQAGKGGLTGDRQLPDAAADRQVLAEFRPWIRNGD
jgi:hypothetical protein